MAEEWAEHVAALVRAQRAAARGAGPGSRGGVLRLPDAGRRLADRGRAARGVPGEGAARGQAQHELDRARRGLGGRASSASPAGCYEHEPFLADFEPFAERVAAAGERAALGQLALKLTAPGRPGHLQRRRAAVPRAGRPRQPAPGRLGPPPRAARASAGRRRARRETREAVADLAAARPARPAPGGVRRRLRAARRRRRRVRVRPRGRGARGGGGARRARHSSPRRATGRRSCPGSTEPHGITVLRARGPIGSRREHADPAAVLGVPAGGRGRPCARRAQAVRAARARGRRGARAHARRRPAAGRGGPPRRARSTAYASRPTPRATSRPSSAGSTT